MPEETINIKKVINIEDSGQKHSTIKRALRELGICDVTREKNAEDGIEAIVEAQKAGVPFGLLITDMHFDFYGELVDDAGDRTIKALREKGIEIPTIICSSQNYQIPGTIGSVLSNDRDNSWKDDLVALLKTHMK